MRRPTGRDHVWSTIMRYTFLVSVLVVAIGAPAAMRIAATNAQEASGESAAAPKRAPAPQRTFVDSIKAGGITGAVIILLSIAAVGLMIEHAISIRPARLAPDDTLADVGEMVAGGRLNEAIEYLRTPDNASMAGEVLLAGLERYQSSEYGFAEYKQACEEAGEEETARLYRKVDWLNLIGVIAPMLGLLGTVEGMIEAFNTIASNTEGRVRPDELADSIGKALVTTFEGLVVAIPAMVAYSFFRNRIDSIVAETGKRIERILAPLARSKR